MPDRNAYPKVSIKKYGQDSNGQILAIFLLLHKKPPPAGENAGGGFSVYGNKDIVSFTAVYAANAACAF